LVIDDLEAVLLQLFAGAVGGAACELGVGRKDRDGLRLRTLRCSDFEKSPRKGVHAVRPNRNHREILRIVEVPVDADSRETDRELVVRDDRRHRRCDEVGAIRPEQQVHLIDRDQLGVDAGNIGRPTLVLIDDELDRSAEQSALGIDVVTPDFERGADHLARRSAGAGQRKAHSDLDGVAALRGCPRESEKPHYERRDKCVQRSPTHLCHRFLPYAERPCAPPLMVHLLFLYFLTWHDAPVVGGVRVLSPDFLAISSSCAASKLTTSTITATFVLPTERIAHLSYGRRLLLWDFNGTMSARGQVQSSQ